MCDRVSSALFRLISGLGGELIASPASADRAAVRNAHDALAHGGVLRPCLCGRLRRGGYRLLRERFGGIRCDRAVFAPMPCLRELSCELRTLGVQPLAPLGTHTFVMTHVLSPSASILLAVVRLVTNVPDPPAMAHSVALFACSSERLADALPCMTRPAFLPWCFPAPA